MHDDLKGEIQKVQQDLSSENSQMETKTDLKLRSIKDTSAARSDSLIFIL